MSNSSPSELSPNQQSQNPMNNDGVSDIKISSPSSPGRLPDQEIKNQMTNDAFSAMETAPADVHAPTAITSSGGDYEPIRSFEDAKNICFVESKKLWMIAGPIIFNMLCNYGINSFTNIFAGHIGNVELSAIAISLSVIGNFSFGFLVSNSFYK